MKIFREPMIGFGIRKNRYWIVAWKLGDDQ
jgi:hypothetical protein